MNEADHLLEQVIIDTLVDWSSVGWVFSICREEGVTPVEARDRALTVLHLGMVERGLLVAGELDPADRFRAWPIDATTAFARVRDQWLAEPEVTPPLYGFPWVDLTEEGEVMARRLGAADRPTPAAVLLLPRLEQPQPNPPRAWPCWWRCR